MANVPPDLPVLLRVWMMLQEFLWKQPASKELDPLALLMRNATRLRNTQPFSEMGKQARPPY